MAYFLFVDECGTDRKTTPYEVVAGLAIEDRDLWRFIRDVHELEELIFGCRYSREEDTETKAKKLLKRKVFKHAAQLNELPNVVRVEQARRCIEDGARAGRIQITALAQSKLIYVRALLDLCTDYRCKMFATLVKDSTMDMPIQGYLTKQYIYLLERFYYFLEDRSDKHQGIIIFDENDKSRSQEMLLQFDQYFKATVKGRERANLIIPEPIFVHSDLTTGVQVADIIAYVISWAYRYRELDKPLRGELLPYLDIIKRFQFKTLRQDDETGENRAIFGVVCI